MRVLHINQSDTGGGAGIAAYRLHQGLLNQSIDSKLLVGFAQTRDSRVRTVKRSSRSENLIGRVTQRLGLNYIHLFNTFYIHREKFYQDADILNFHNLHSSYFNYLAISKLTASKPAIFTLHDMWSFTGHCSYSYDCDRWKIGCGQCPYPETYPSIRVDSSHLEWKLKDLVYGQSNLSVITPSRWLTQQAQASMLNRFKISHIPYGIDVDTYKPIDSNLCRKILDILPNKLVLLFGAASLEDSRKGGDLLLRALEALPQSLKTETILLTFGSGGETIASRLGISTLNLGYISSDRLKSVVFSAADLFIFPTRADNLPLVLQESLACGTPVVSFDVGGVPDLVRPGITGYLAPAEDTADFSKGIVDLLTNQAVREQMSKNCREVAVNEYSLELQAKRYIEVYNSSLT